MRSLASRGGALAVVVALTAALAAPPTAWAITESGLLFHFSGSNGYGIVVKGRGETASVTAARPDSPSSRSGSSSTYIARAAVSANAIRASFGEMGRVAMRFRPSGRVVHSKPQRGCIGPDRQTVRFGVFTGSVRFRGEDGYTSANVHHARGRVVTPLELDCPLPRIGASPPSGPHARTLKRSTRTTVLTASSLTGFVAMDFLAIARRSGVFFEARIDQSVGSLAISRTAYALAPRRTFASNAALSFASVTPPAPFSGTGSLQRDGRGVRTWTGSLAVSFPGAPGVPFAGPQFKTQLIRNW